MRFPVNFDSEPSIAAEEVEHVRPGRMLSAKLEAVWTLPKPFPEDHFG